MGNFLSLSARDEVRTVVERYLSRLQQGGSKTFD